MAAGNNKIYSVKNLYFTMQSDNYFLFMDMN